ncbi:PAS domain S-box protein [Ketobacter sp.]|uniref:PAS domain S-box protein n=1 Tax=Ketobacter sp. TaxID=2083498 RepID=UPI000F1CF5C5|nr:PAS domain S-box protein [Ketobacter sp.]RLU01261.1 MAG: PAS domain S-box protein [Ketobacter sp.]
MSPIAAADIRRLESTEELLNARNRKLLLAIALPLFCVVLAFALHQYRSQRATVLSELEQSSAALGIALDGVTAATQAHVTQMQTAMQDCLRQQSASPHPLHRHLQPLQPKDGSPWTLDPLPAETRAVAGQLVRLTADGRVADVHMELCALELFNLIRLTHQVNPYFQWSYFLSADEQIAAIHPWVSSTALSQGQGFRSVREAIRSWFQYDVFLGVLPARNGQRQLHWTLPYIDAVGAGAMISLGAPVYVDDQFKGGVGADVKLSTLEQFLQAFPRTHGRLLIVDHQGMVLADTQSGADNAIESITTLLPDWPWPANLAIAAPTRLTHDTGTLLLRPASHAPWSVLYLVQNSEIQQLLIPRLIPYAVILAALILTCLLALFLLRHELINPALSLVNYIQRSSVDPATEKPRLPTLWAVWAEVIAHTVTENVNATRRLYRSEERLQQILNNSSALISVRDPAGYFVSANQSFLAITAAPHSPVAGKHLRDLFPDATAMNLLRTDQQVVSNRATLELEETITLHDGEHTYLSNRFPLYDADGAVYGVCSVSTDITKEKRTQAVLQEAAFGVSRAKGKEVFDVLVTHLAAAVGARMALIGLLEEDHKHIQTRALCDQGEISSNIIYSTEDSPCIKVARQGYHCFSHSLAQCFPGCEVVQAFQFESYAGVPLIASTGETLGILAVLDSYTLPDSALLESVLKIFAARAVAELERERSDAAMKVSETSYRSIFEASESAILVHDISTWAIVDVNPKACELWGYNREQMLNLNIADISSGIAPYTGREALELMQRAARGERLRFEWQRQERSGKLGWNEVFLRRASIGGNDRILAITNDISDRKQTEQRLRASEEQYRAVFNASSDALLVVDASGAVVETNRRFEQLTGHSTEETRGKYLNDVFDQLHPSQLARMQPASGSSGYRTEVALKCRQHDNLNCEVHAMPVTYRGAQHTLVVGRDMTELRRAEQELARQRDALRQSEKLSAMGALLAGVAHELNNPLAILMGRSALLQAKISDPNLLTDVEKINAAAERCARIVRTFLAMARQRPSQRNPFQLNDVIIAALDLLGYGLRASDIEVSTDLTPGLPLTNMDSDQIGQVIMNLIINAQQALEQSPGKRCIQIHSFLEPDALCLRVRDNGPGIPAQVRNRIFDPFFTTKAEGVGTGVGLSVSRAIVREHKGEMLLEDASPWTSFLIRLPTTPHPAQSTAINNPLMEQEQTRSVLIIDDEAEVAQLLAEILRAAGFKTTELASGRAAVEWLDTNACDIILSDVRMKDMDGIALWRYLTEHHPQLTKRMAFITGDTLSPSIAPFLQETGLNGLEKPFTPEAVLKLVASLEAV